MFQYQIIRRKYVQFWCKNVAGKFRVVAKPITCATIVANSRRALIPVKRYSYSTPTTTYYRTYRFGSPWTQSALVCGHRNN